MTLRMRNAFPQCLLIALLCSGLSASSQALLDRVVARVNGQAITLSDARAAEGLGLVDLPAGQDRMLAATRGLIDRQLMLNEVSRFSPPEPKPEDLDREMATIESRAGTREELNALMRATGLNTLRVREIARDTLRIRAYLTQRFGANVVQSTIDQWVNDLRRRATIACQLPGC